MASDPGRMLAAASPVPLALLSIMIFFEEEYQRHVKLTKDSEEDEAKAQKGELEHTPLFSSHIVRHLNDAPYYTQYGVLGNQQTHYRDGNIVQNSGRGCKNVIYGNHREPWSAFICGSQGGGKSYTLATLLENCLLSGSSFDSGMNPSPTPVIAFCWDTQSSEAVTQYCELVHFASAGVDVRIVVAPSRYHQMKKFYKTIPGLKDKLKITPLKLLEKHLKMDNMMAMMNVKERDATPLYLAVVWNILAEMAEDDPLREGIDYEAFIKKLDACNLNEAQTQMLWLRLKLLEDCLEIEPRKKIISERMRAKEPGQHEPIKPYQRKGDILVEDLWSFKPGTLTVVDLSSDTVTKDAACALFNVCTNLFMADRGKGGRVIAMDEAHKYLKLKDSGGAAKLTDTLMSIIRQQRHLGTRVIVATQDPELDPRLLDLCNVTIVHQFSSKKWYEDLKQHLAGAQDDDKLFSKIVDLPRGTALMFSTKAMVHVESEKQGEGEGASEVLNIRRLRDGYIKIKIRERHTVDRGESIMADDKHNPDAETYVDNELKPKNVTQGASLGGNSDGDNEQGNSASEASQNARSIGTRAVEFGSHQSQGGRPLGHDEVEVDHQIPAIVQEESALPPKTDNRAKINQNSNPSHDEIERSIRAHVNTVADAKHGDPGHLKFVDVRRAVQANFGGIPLKAYNKNMSFGQTIKIVDDETSKIKRNAGKKV